MATAAKSPVVNSILWACEIQKDSNGQGESVCIFSVCVDDLSKVNLVTESSPAHTRPADEMDVRDLTEYEQLEWATYLSAHSFQSRKSLPWLVSMSDSFLNDPRRLKVLSRATLGEYVNITVLLKNGTWISDVGWLHHHVRGQYRAMAETLSRANLYGPVERIIVEHVPTFDSAEMSNGQGIMAARMESNGLIGRLGVKKAIFYKG